MTTVLFLGATVSIDLSRRSRSEKKVNNNQSYRPTEYDEVRLLCSAWADNGRVDQLQWSRRRRWDGIFRGGPCCRRPETR